MLTINSEKILTPQFLQDIINNKLKSSSHFQNHTPNPKISSQKSTPNSSSIPQPWAKLISISTFISNYTLTKDRYTIGHSSKVDIQLKYRELEATHCEIYKEENGNAYIKDLSIKGTFIGKQKIGTGNVHKLEIGDKIYFHFKNFGTIEDVIGFVYCPTNPSNNPLKHSREESEETSQKLATLAEENKKLKKVEHGLSDEMTCCICLSLIYDCATTMPCLHNFCGSCLSQSIETSLNCPKCREPLEKVKRNTTINNIINLYLESNPDKKRPPEECKEMDLINKFKNDNKVDVKLLNCKAGDFSRRLYDSPIHLAIEIWPGTTTATNWIDMGSLQGESPIEQHDNEEEHENSDDGEFDQPFAPYEYVEELISPPPVYRPRSPYYSPTCSERSSHRAITISSDSDSELEEDPIF